MQALGLLRSMVGITQAELARRAGVHRITLNRAEHGVLKVSRSMWERIDGVLARMVLDRITQHLKQQATDPEVIEALEQSRRELAEREAIERTLENG
jgi:transcriptional regulator with XRE-family HTH domain